MTRAGEEGGDPAPVGDDGALLLEAALASAATAGALLETLVRGCGLGIALIDRSLRYAWANDALAVIDGISAEEHVERPVGEVLPGAVADAMEALARRVLRTGRAARDELVWTRGEDGALSRRMTFHPITGPAGDAMGVVAVVEELREGERAARELIDEHATFSHLADSVPAMIWMGDRRGRRTFLNRRWLEFTGGTLEGELDDGWQERVHPEDLPRLTADHRAALEEGAALVVEYRLRRADGEYRWVTDRGVPRLDADGALLGHIGSCTDLTDVRELDAASREAKRLLDLVIDSAPIGFGLLDRELRFLRVNAALARINGLPAEAHLGRRPQELLPDDPGARAESFHQALLDEVLRTGEGVVDVVATEEAPRGGGPARHLQESWYPIRDPATDEITAIGTFVNDISERVWAEGRLRLLSEVGAVLETGSREEERLARLVELVVPALADGCAIDLLDAEGEPRLVAVAGLDASAERALREGSGGGTLAAARERALSEVVREGRAVQLSEADGLSGAAPWSAVSAPLRARGRTLGALTLAISRPGRRYVAEDLDVAVQLGRRAGLAVDNLRLFRREMEIAHTLQRSLLPPRLPDIPGLDAAARYTPMGEGAEVGGDFYDLFAAGRSWGAAIGDVCGKGAEAAALTSLARHGIRALGRRDPAPSRLLADLNELIRSERGGDTLFFTVLYARLVPTPRGFRVNVASAGHPPAVLARANGRVETVGRPGRMLGPFREVRAQDATAQLRPGDALVLYTDGVVESRREGELFGEERLHRTVADAAGAPADELAGRIERAVNDFQTGALRDDLAVLVLRVLPRA